MGTLAAGVHEIRSGVLPHVWTSGIVPSFLFFLKGRARVPVLLTKACVWVLHELWNSGPALCEGSWEYTNSAHIALLWGTAETFGSGVCSSCLCGFHGQNIKTQPRLER